MYENGASDDNQRKFKGVWIRKSLWNRRDLTWFEKCLLCEIDSFETCFASNAYLAAHMGTSEQTIQNAISKFRSISLVIDWGHVGRKRQITVADCVSADPVNSKSEVLALDNSKPRGLPTLNPGVYIDTSIEQSKKESTESQTRLRQAETIYKEYPLKAKRPAALRAIIRALKSHDYAFLLARTMAYAKIRPHGTDYTPYPATWFNAEQFSDDEATWFPRSNGSSSPTKDPPNTFRDQAGKLRKV